MWIRALSVVTICALAGVTACSSSDSAEEPATVESAPASVDDEVDVATTTAAPATTDAVITTEAATTVPATTVPATTVPAAPEFVDGTLEITDPTVGALNFDVRSAGDPALVADGKAVLLLHGFPETNRTWDVVAGELADAGYYAVAINQRGYSSGARPEGAENYAVTHLVDDVYAVADAIGADTFHVVGHDFGSLVAWSVAGRDTIEGVGRISSLTAMSVGHPLAFIGARADPDGDQAARSGYFEDFQAPDSQDMFLADDAAFYRSLFDGAGYTDEDLDVYLEVLGTPEAMSAALDWYRAIDVAAAESAQTIEVPTLFIWSTGDIALGREQAETTANFVSGPYTYVEIPDASHWVIHEAPDLVTDALLSHLAAATG